jgi:repressor LexA
MKALHPTQQKLLELLAENIDNPLTIIELKDALLMSSTSLVFHHIQQLERKGHLKRNPSNPKDYIILDNPEKAVVYINQYGLAECGPNGSILDGTPVDRLPIASRLIRFPVADAFIVIAKGDSMEPKISPGDIIIAQKSKAADSGDIIVCINDEKVIIKKLYKTNSALFLHSINPLHAPFLPAEDFRIEGVVRNIIHFS